uniref:vesicle-associated membrane protein 7-like n=1 Tax=Styela clava TaxID=7725 RepID=UPI001939C800|nr:vesicle-associated membrane protein 7-like [Styela clava]
MLFARETTILAKCASCAGNFDEVTDQILKKIPDKDTKMTYSQGNYLFHYVRENGIVYYAITEDEFERSKAFQFLGEIKRKFQRNYGDLALTALPYAMDNEFSRELWSHMQKYSKPVVESPEISKVKQVNDQLDELKGIMVKNIDSITERGENLNLLVDKTEDLSQSSVTFKKQSTNLARKLFWKNVKITIVLIVVAIIVIYFLVSAGCGGLSWPKCVGKSNNGSRID